MKKLKIYLIISLLLGITLYSCKEDDLSSDSVIKDNIVPKTEFDYWLLDNYTYPYNIMFKYKMEDIETSKGYELSPAIEENCIAMAKLLKYVWLEAYVEVQGIDFVRAYTPKVVHLIGSGGYNSTGSVTVGSADNGMKMTLYNINNLSPDNMSSIGMTQRHIRTIYHEFSHILHQNKNYPIEFGQITNDEYINDDWNKESDATAYVKGFVSSYSRKETNEDFVEIIAHFVVYGQDNWDRILAAAGTDGANKINQKFEIVQDYLRNSWDLDIYELRRVYENRVASLHTLDFKNL